MKEIPILFSTDMVKAILEGRKTQTRRIVKLQPDNDSYYEMKFGNGVLTIDYNMGVENPKVKCPYGQPGDIIWVRESWCNPQLFDGNEKDYYYRADGEIQRNAEGRWKPSIHMPKEASRIWLEVTEIRAEQLQDITEADAIAEGILYHDCEVLGRRYKDYFSDASEYGHTDHDYPSFSSPAESYRSLWQKINGPDSWNENPWVWCLTFKVLSTTGKPSHFLPQSNTLIGI